MGVGAIAAGLFFGVVCLAAGRKFSGASRGQARFALWASLLFLGAYVFRIVLGYTSEGFTTDTDTFKSWAALANSVGFGQIYHQDIFLDYPPGYLYVLALLDNRDGGTPTSRLSLQTFLTRVTQVRLRLQQVTNATDPQAMTRLLAQTVFQGKAVDLTETRDYGSLVAAGLGQQWSGFGQTLFVRPMEQAWQQVLTPAAESLNAQWRSAVVEDWNSAFGGRYPFKNTSSEVSLPLLAKYLNSETGRIARFLQTRLNGVLHKEGSRWMADSINAQGLTFNPAFLQAMNTLSHLSDVAFANGEAGLHFALRPGTADGVMQTELVIDSQKLVYMNQMPVWRRFSWPADTEAPGASLSWISTRAGTRQYGDFPGAWGWIRLLDKAVVSAYPGTSSSWSLSWKAPDGLLLNYTLRTEAGEGPLALLALRNFTLPETIFSVRAPAERVPLTDDIPGEEGY